MSMCGGISTSRAASDLSRHDFPQPFGPSSPYRLHAWQRPFQYKTQTPYTNKVDIVLQHKGACA